MHTIPEWNTETNPTSLCVETCHSPSGLVVGTYVYIYIEIMQPLVVSYGSIASLGSVGRELWKLGSIWAPPRWNSVAWQQQMPQLIPAEYPKSCPQGARNASLPTFICSKNSNIKFQNSNHTFLHLQLRNCSYYSNTAFPETRAVFKEPKSQVGHIYFPNNWTPAADFQTTEHITGQLSRRIWPGCTACGSLVISFMVISLFNLLFNWQLECLRLKTNAAASARCKGSEPISIKLKPKRTMDTPRMFVMFSGIHGITCNLSSNRSKNIRTCQELRPKLTF